MEVAALPMRDVTIELLFSLAPYETLGLKAAVSPCLRGSLPRPRPATRRFEEAAGGWRCASWFPLTFFSG